MLVGSYRYTVDSKKRIYLPVHFRGELGVNCVLSRDIKHKCLRLYSAEQWKEYMKKIEALPTVQMNAVRQLIYPNTEVVDTDSSGRVVLNQRLCAGVDIADEKEVVVNGAGLYAEIWNVNHWELFSEEMNSEANRQAVLAALEESGF